MLLGLYRRSWRYDAGTVYYFTEIALFLAMGSKTCFADDGEPTPQLKAWTVGWWIERVC